MYRTHFGFAKRPFDSGIARDDDLYVGAPQQAALGNLAMALTTLDSVAVLTGPAGVGKTTLASAALRAESARIALGWLGTVPADPHDLPELLLAEFGLGTVRAGRVERLQAWRQFLSEMGATESRVLVIVEHAEELPVPVLRTLESLTAADPNGCPGANIVLTGQPQVHALLAAPALQALRQRVRLRQPLEPLTREETERYVAHRLERAGGHPAELLTPSSLDALQTYSAGVPRVLNNLCESALTLAASRGAALLAPELIEHVAVELFGLAPGAASAVPAADLCAAPEAEVPVLTDAVEAPNASPAHAAADLALLSDVRLEVLRTAQLRDEQQSFAAAAEALASTAGTDVDEFAATALLGAGRR